MSTFDHNGAALRDFCAFNKLKITNPFYRHKDIHKFTWEARGTKSVIDCIIINDRLKAAGRVKGRHGLRGYTDAAM